MLEGGKKGERWVVNLVICVCGKGFPIYNWYLCTNYKKAHT